jgi:hypothetical protein
MVRVPEPVSDTGSSSHTFTAETWQKSCAEAWAHALRLQTENHELRLRVGELERLLFRKVGY